MCLTFNPEDLVKIHFILLSGTPLSRLCYNKYTNYITEYCIKLFKLEMDFII